MHKFLIIALLPFALIACATTAANSNPITQAKISQTKAPQAKPTSIATLVARPSSDIANEIQQAVQLTNQLRAQKGLAPLSIDPALSAYAQLRASELVSKFSHDRPNGESYSRVITGGSTNGENIAAGSSSATATVMGQWKNSPGHYANIINPHFTKIGIGMVKVPNDRFGAYWVQVFGNHGTTAPFVFE